MYSLREVIPGEEKIPVSKPICSRRSRPLKAKSKIETYEKLEPVSTAKASCWGSGGGCGGGGKAQALDPKIEQEAKAKGLEYYEKKTQKKAASAKVTDFGCHIQVDIIEDGKAVVSLTYRQGEVQDLK